MKIKRLSFVLLLCLLCVLLVREGEAGDLEMYTVSNTTAARVKTQISITTVIIPGKHVILGYELIPFGSGCVDPYVELHDVATTGGQTQTSGGTMFSANELDTSPLKADVRIFPKPKKIALGLSINLGGYSAVIIYYERMVK